MVVIGGALAVVVPALSWVLTTLVGSVEDAGGWWALLDDAPHSQRPLWLVSATASAVAVLGFAPVVADRLRGWSRPW